MRITDKIILLVGNFKATIAAALTANRTLSVPDKDGTIALLSDITGTSLKAYTERIPSTSITSTAILGQLASLPSAASEVFLNVNGQTLNTLDSNPAFSINGREITWMPANSFNLEADDEIIALYFTEAAISPTTFEYPAYYRTPWVAVPLLNGWTFLGGTFYDGSYRKHLNGMVETTGLVSKPSGAADDQAVGNIPLACCPSKSLIIPARSYNSSTDKNLDGATFVKPPATATTASSSNFKPNGTLTYSPGRQGTEDVTNAFWFNIGGTWTTDVETAVFFGDSNTIGEYLVPLDYTKRWSYLLATAEGIREDNVGISGTVLQNTATTLANNARDRVVADVLNRFPDRIYMIYGTNDVRRNDVNYTVANFKNDYLEIMDLMLGRGIPPTRITIGTMPYGNPANYAGTSGFDAATDARYVQHQQAIREVAIAKKVKFADIYQYMKDNSPLTLLESDGVHLNRAGHSITATLMRNATVIAA